ncbi:MAG: hypothetical protein KF767_08870 [Bdellovibrionaceae bacterium]|nr:hypothetical protein [Pseudobdellovibrionaceae bacterium]
MSEMEQSNLSSSEGVAVETSSAAETSAPEVSGDPGAVTPAPETPAYTPNWKFKAAGQEHEIDEEYRSYIKSAEDEKRLKRLFEQAKGLDPVRAERDKYREESGVYRNELGQYETQFSKIKALRSQGQMMKALRGLGLTPEEIYVAAKQQMDFDSLPQQAQDIYHQNQEAERQAQHLASQNESYANQMAALQVSVKRTELSQALANPEIKDIASRFDAVNGEGAFYAQVVQEGKAQFALNQQDISAFEAVNAVVSRFRPFLTQAAPAAPAQMQPAVPQAPKEVPVIPSAKGASQVAGGSRIKSLADMKKFAQTLED